MSALSARDGSGIEGMGGDGSKGSQPIWLRWCGLQVALMGEPHPALALALLLALILVLALVLVLLTSLLSSLIALVLALVPVRNRPRRGCLQWTNPQPAPPRGTNTQRVGVETPRALARERSVRWSPLRGLLRRQGLAALAILFHRWAQSPLYCP